MTGIGMAVVVSAAFLLGLRWVLSVVMELRRRDDVLKVALARSDEAAEALKGVKGLEERIKRMELARLGGAK